MVSIKFSENTPNHGGDLSVPQTLAATLATERFFNYYFSKRLYSDMLQVNSEAWKPFLDRIVREKLCNKNLEGRVRVELKLKLES